MPKSGIFNRVGFTTLARLLVSVNPQLGGGTGGRRSQIRPGPNERRRPILQVPVVAPTMAHATLYPKGKAIVGRPLRLREVQLKRG